MKSRDEIPIEPGSDAMFERLESTTGSTGGSPSKRPHETAPFAALYELQTKDGLAESRIRELEERRKRLWFRLTSFWPVAAGLLVSAFAPQLRDLVAPYQPWGMWIVFPFAVLSGRPELSVLGDVARVLPQFMLFAQFPLEGLLAKFFLRNHVTFLGVAGQLFFYHALGVAELWLLTGAVMQIMPR
jgi:hypothetical protein